MKLHPFHISFSHLWTNAGGASQERLSLAQLTNGGGHIHGLLQIAIGKGLLPQLGYFGPDDVCFNQWVCELKNALDTLRSSSTASYIYDEGEQGQPAFRFDREGGVAFVSIVDSQLSDGEANPDWERVPFAFSDFEREVEGFLARLRTHILSESPDIGQRWWAQVVEQSL